MPDSKNPQSRIILSPRLGTEAEVLDKVDPELKFLFQKAKQLILDTFQKTYPEINVYVFPSTKENIIYFGFGEKKMSEYFCYIKPIKTGYINLGFFWASKLPDENKLLEGTGENLRHVKIRNLERLNSKEVLDLLVEGFKERFNFINNR